MAATVSSFPVVNMEKLETEERATAMEVIRDGCENWGFFEVRIYILCRLLAAHTKLPQNTIILLTYAPHLITISNDLTTHSRKNYYFTCCLPDLPPPCFFNI
jgi:hypothetical protein